MSPEFRNLPAYEEGGLEHQLTQLEISRINFLTEAAVSLGETMTDRETRLDEASEDLKFRISELTNDIPEDSDFSDREKVDIIINTHTRESAKTAEELNKLTKDDLFETGSLKAAFTQEDLDEIEYGMFNDFIVDLYQQEVDKYVESFKLWANDKNPEERTSKKETIIEKSKEMSTLIVGTVIGGLILRKLKRS